MLDRDARNRRARTQQRTEHVEIEHLAQGLGLDRFEARIRSSDAATVDEVSECAEFTVYGGKRPLDIALASHVTWEGDRGASLGLDRRHDHLGSGRIAQIVDRNVEA